MPALDQALIRNLADRLEAHLHRNGIESTPEYINSGGSAAVFKVETSEGVRAFKVFDPRFLQGAGGPSERRRLELQRQLIGHTCPYLIAMYEIEEAEDTAFVKMDFCSWPQLSRSLSDIPDEEVASLILQLVTVVRFLEERNIVHRDIKPENIHISPDFKSIKVLDLGVARTFDSDNSTDAAMTDRQDLRPFVATAQYSSPEYLFRLDEPTPNLWKGLNLYQVGAVLHDLIMKSALFEEEVSKGNRWLVARAVLTKTPSFSDNNPNRLASLKALSARCLAKDMETRLQTVRWSDFDEGASIDPMARLEDHLKRRAESLRDSDAALENRLRHDRVMFANRIMDSVKCTLIDRFGNTLPLAINKKEKYPEHVYYIEFTQGTRTQLLCSIRIQWQDGISRCTAMISVNDVRVCEAKISESEEQASYSIACAICTAVKEQLDRIEVTGATSTYGNATTAGGKATIEVK